VAATAGGRLDVYPRIAGSRLNSRDEVVRKVTDGAGNAAGVWDELILHRTAPGSPGGAQPDTAGKMMIFLIGTSLALGIGMLGLGMLLKDS
jgi:hypothetical protein